MDNDFESAGLQSKQLFVEHIAARLEAMEAGRKKLRAVAYRVHVKMLREALRAFPRSQLERLLGSAHLALREALYNRFFESTGTLHEAGCAAVARAIKHEADQLIARLQLP